MQGGSILVVFLPLVLVVVMLGLGMSLTIRDFRKVLQAPRLLLIALVLQTIVLPIICFGMVHAFGLEPALAVGMMLLAASPGGPSSNLYSHLAGGDVALGITLTAINSVLAVATMPLIANLSVAYFLGDTQAIPLQIDKILQVVGLVLAPMLVGMWLRQRYPALADSMERPVKILSTLFLLVVVLVAFAREWETLKVWAPIVGLAALTFNIVSLAVGYLGSRMTRIDRRQAIAIGLEIGIHNAALAITIALSPLLLDNATMAIPAAIYGLFAYVTAAAFVYWLKRMPAAAGSIFT